MRLPETQQQWLWLSIVLVAGSIGYVQLELNTVQGQFLEHEVEQRGIPGALIEIDQDLNAIEDEVIAIDKKLVLICTKLDISC